MFKNEVLIYKGNWKNGKREGNGKYFFTNGIVYDGMIRICYVSNLHIQKIITRNEHSIINVPFNKGEYSHDNYAFIYCFHFYEEIDYEFANSSSDWE